MSLLSNLTLSYEILADDPIEMGIHYGKSILNALVGKSSQSDSPAAVTAGFTAQRFKQPISPRFASRPQPVRRAETAISRTASLSRRDFMDYSIRPRVTETRSVSYTQRSLVGAL